MYDHRFLFTPEPESEKTTDDRTLEHITRYASFFCLGVFVAHLVRVFSELQPLFWILAFTGLGWLGYAIKVKRSIRLIGIAAIVIAALVAGHWDGLVHGTAQGLANIEEAIR